MSVVLNHGSLQVLVVAFCIGIVVGVTGMGGGALMTPALILLGVPPTSAVANDLVAAAINKSAGAAIHLRHGSPNLKLVRWLVVGSVPMGLAGSWIVSAVGTREMQQQFLKVTIGWTLLFAAAVYTCRIYVERVHAVPDHPHEADPALKPLTTIAVGAVGGLLVGVTSVGSGSVVMACLLLAYPTLSPVRLVGTDLVQAVPLVIAAAIGHVLISGVDWWVLIPLILGGTSGTMLGARSASLISQSVIQRGIVILLSLTGLEMLEVFPSWVGSLSAAVVVLGPVVWELGRNRTNIWALRGSSPLVKRPHVRRHQKGP